MTIMMHLNGQSTLWINVASVWDGYGLVFLILEKDVLETI